MRLMRALTPRKGCAMNVREEIRNTINKIYKETGLVIKHIDITWTDVSSTYKSEFIIRDITINADAET